MHLQIETMICMVKRYSCLVFFSLSLIPFFFSLSYGQHQTSLKIDRLFSTSQEAFKFTGSQKIHGLSISGSGNLHNPDSLIRIILVGRDSHESLVYEIYPLLAEGDTVRAINAGEETRFLEGIYPLRLIIQLVNASFQLDEITVTDEPSPYDTNVPENQKRSKEQARLEKLSRLDENIRKKGLKWTAGETSISKLSFEEKRNLFGSGQVPNLQGAEYYTGGVYEIEPTNKPAPRSFRQGLLLVDAFDWRQKHGANNPESPYYDGDPSGNGWMTPVRNQDTCGSCWAFGALGSIEALTNIYFNQHIDLDLSEQDLLSCSGAGNCAGGSAGESFRYISDYGVTDEECFPYSATEEVCTDKCPNPHDMIFVDYDPTIYMGGPDDEKIKSRLIRGGPAAFFIFSWSHYVTLVGYLKDQTDGRTIWSFKSSWGQQWGENGYGNIKCGQLGETGCEMLAPLTPVRSAITSYAIGCFDLDGDGYYNWGISETMPDTCPRNISAREDCDDSNPFLGFMDSSGNCVAIHPIDIDIAPGDTDNCIGLASNGAVTVAVLSTESFDAMAVDPPTVTFCGAGSTGWTAADTDGDGDADLLFSFNIADLKLAENASEAPLEGSALDGTPVIGKDMVCILPDDPPYFENASLPSTVIFPGKACFSGSVKDDFGLKEIQMNVVGPETVLGFSPTSLSGTSSNLALYCFDSRDDQFAGKAGSYTVTLTVTDSADQSASEAFILERLVGDSDGDGAADDLDRFPDDPGEQSDADGDGSGDNADCDDDHLSIHPGAQEVSNGLDDNCDGVVDEGFLEDPIKPAGGAANSGGGSGGCFISSIKK